MAQLNSCLDNVLKLSFTKLKQVDFAGFHICHWTQDPFWDPCSGCHLHCPIDINSLICANDCVECEHYGNTRTCHADFEQRNRQIHLKCSVTQDVYTSKVPWVVAQNFDHLPDIYSNHPQNQTTCNSARLATSQTWKALSALWELAASSHES